MSKHVSSDSHIPLLHCPTSHGSSYVHLTRVTSRYSRKQPPSVMERIQTCTNDTTMRESVLTYSCYKLNTLIRKYPTAESITNSIGYEFVPTLDQNHPCSQMLRSTVSDLYSLIALDVAQHRIVSHGIHSKMLTSRYYVYHVGRIIYDSFLSLNASILVQLLSHMVQDG